MNDRSPDNWKGGRKSPREAEREAAATPGWKRSKRKAAAPGRRRRWTRLIIPVALLSFLVALAIWVFQLAQPVHTHFLVLDLLSGSEHTDAPPPPPLDFSSLLGSQGPFPVQKVSFASGQTLELPEITADDALTSEHVLVLYLQTQLLAAPGNRFYCLDSNSTPDLSDGSQYKELSILKNRLISLRKQSLAPIVLIVDRPVSEQSWRLGDLQADFTQEILAWPGDGDQQISGLVVMASCSGNEQSATAFVGSGGQTVFGHCVVRGFSEDGDLNHDDQLHLAEFCRYVTDETNRWVRQHRRLSGQQVLISPPIEELRNQDVVLMKALPKSPGDINYPATENDSLARLARLWERREKLADRLAWRWHPQSWQSATEYLLRAQSALLDGDTALATKLSDKANQKLTQLATFTDQVVNSTDELTEKTGLPQRWLTEFPNAWRFNDVAAAKDPSQNKTNAAEAENVLNANLQAYPFEKLDLVPPEESTRTTLLSNRKMAETAAAYLLSVTASLQKTVRMAEEQLLQPEDLVFTRHSAAQPEDSVRQSWEIIQRFANAHQQAEFVFQDSLRQSESLAHWAAEYPWPTDKQSSDKWRTLLNDNLPTAVPESQVIRQQMADASALADNAKPGDGDIAVRLRSDVFRLLAASRMLGSMLHPQEPETGFASSDLKRMADDLTIWQQETQTCLQDVESRLTAIAGRISNPPETREGQVRVYRQLRATLRVANLSIEMRSRLLTALLSVEKKLSAPDGDIGEPDIALNAVAKDAGLWQLHCLSLLGHTEELTKATQAVRIMPTSAENSSHSQLAEYGNAVRAFWNKSRINAQASLNQSGTDNEQKLRTADRRCRGMSAYDDFGRSPTAHLHAVWRVQYCLLHIDRLLQSQWILPNDQKPWNEKSWYATNVNAWMNVASDAALSISTSPGKVPDFLNAELQQRRKLLAAAATWSISASPQIRDVDIGDQQTPQKDVAITIKMDSQSLPPGTAAMRFLPDAESAATGLIRFENNAQPLELTAGTQDAATVVKRVKVAETADCESIPYITSVFFRGRDFSSASPLIVTPCAPDEFVVTRVARPMTAEILLTGTDRRPIAFVLDMSSSMNDPIQNKDDDKGDDKKREKRIAVALETLSEIVSGLDDRTTASLRVFGHRRTYIKGGARADQKTNPEYIKRFEFNAQKDAVDPQRDVKREVDPTKLHLKGQQKFTDVLNRLKESGPYGVTPLARALREALEQDLNNKPGIVVAITDGMATDVGRQNSFDDQRKDLIRALERNSGSKVVIVAFDLNANDPKRVAERKALTAVFVNECKIPKDNLVDADDKDTLTKTIRDGLDPLEYAVNSRLGEKKAEFGNGVKGLIPSNDYQVRYADIQTDGPVALGLGDRIHMEVEWKQKPRFVFRRSKSNVFEEAQRPAGDISAPWILRFIDTEMQKYRSPARSGLGRATISLMLDHRIDEQPVRQPAEIEFRFTSNKDFRPQQVREEYTFQWGAPGYRITIDEWPLDETIQAEALWKMQPTRPDQTIEYARLPDTQAIGAGRLPEATLSSTLRDGTLQIRLAPKTPTPDAKFSTNAVENIRVEIGSSGELKGPEHFQADDVLTTIHRTATGAVIFEFHGEYTAEKLANREIGLTSQAARHAGAIRPPPLIIDHNLIRDIAAPADETAAVNK